MSNTFQYVLEKIFLLYYTGESIIWKSRQSRTCLRIAFRRPCIPLCGGFGVNKGGIAGYVTRIPARYAAKWGVLCPKGGIS
uniref:DUF6783 domain-containing protein n=1 Tax=Enterocloster aldenensis TaxID=358742 RepID=UPI003F49A5AD